MSYTPTVSTLPVNRYWMFCTAIILFSLLSRLVFLSSSTLLVEEAYYWNYAMHLDFGYLDHPPMVALLVKFGTLLFGNKEWAVRIASPFCWVLTVFFSYRLAECMQKNAGIYTLLLLSILPFFFLHGMIMTPDVPLLVCWSATLYYLYKALIKEEANAWYYSGLWCGLGLLSKYSIVLLPFSACIYLLLTKDARRWFLKKEPWIALLIACILFAPVIYWNMSHDWASFTFQSTRRVTGRFRFSLHVLLGLLVLFLTPIGIFEFGRLITNNAIDFEKKNRSFILCFTLIPLLVFSIFSLAREVKFNWIGPVILALIPWLSVRMSQKAVVRQWNVLSLWCTVGAIFLSIILTAFVMLFSGYPHYIHQKLFVKLIDWEQFTLQLHQRFDQAATLPTIIPLDAYNIASELNFYQTKLMDKGQINRVFPITGRHVFGYHSLMYDYWTKTMLMYGQPVLMIAHNATLFTEASNVDLFIKQKSELVPVLPLTEGHRQRKAYFYQEGLWNIKAAMDRMDQ